MAQNVNVISIKSNFVDVNGILVLEVAELVLDAIDYFFIQNIFSELGCDLDVVVALRDIVVPTPEVSVEFGHTKVLYVVCCVCLRIRCLRPVLPRLRAPLRSAVRRVRTRTQGMGSEIADSFPAIFSPFLSYASINYQRCRYF